MNDTSSDNLVFCKQPDHFIGRTVIGLSHRGSHVLLRLDDDTVVSFSLDYGYGDEADIVLCSRVYIDDEDLRNLGFIDQTEYRYRYEATLEQARKDAEIRDRREYERLSERFAND